MARRRGRGRAGLAWGIVGGVLVLALAAALVDGPGDGAMAPQVATRAIVPTFTPTVTDAPEAPTATQTAQDGRSGQITGIDASNGAEAVSTLPADAPTATPIPPTATQVPPTPIPPTPTLPYSWVREVDGQAFGSDCACDQGDALNCGDFPQPWDAQSCYLRCLELAGGDVHALDRDADGDACEWDR